jgi:TolA-binding protein
MPASAAGDPAASNAPGSSKTDKATPSKKTTGASAKKPPAEPVAETAVVPVLPRESPVKPDAGELLLTSARGKAEQRLYDQAVADLQTIVHDHSTSPVAPSAYLLLAKIQSQQGRSDDAIATATALRTKFPGHVASAEGSVLLGQWIERSKSADRVAAARGVLADVPVKFPDSPWAPRALAAKALLETRERVKETDPAFGNVPAQFVTNRQIAEKYVTSPEAELALWAIGEEYENRKRYDLAAKAFTDLATHFPETRYDAWWRAAELYEKRLKDRAAARSAYAKVPSSSRNFKDAQRRAIAQ